MRGHDWIHDWIPIKCMSRVYLTLVIAHCKLCHNFLACIISNCIWNWLPCLKRLAHCSLAHPTSGTEWTSSYTIKSAIAGKKHWGGEPPRRIIAAKTFPIVLKSHALTAERLCTIARPCGVSAKRCDCFSNSCLNRRNSSLFGPPVSTAGSPQNRTQNGFDKSRVARLNCRRVSLKRQDLLTFTRWEYPMSSSSACKTELEWVRMRCLIGDVSTGALNEGGGILQRDTIT